MFIIILSCNSLTLQSTFVFCIVFLFHAFKTFSTKDLEKKIEATEKRV